MKTTVDLDEELGTRVRKTASLIGEKPATVLRLAIRAGLDEVAGRFQAPRPEGYFLSAYKKYPRQRQHLERAVGEATIQRPER